MRAMATDTVGSIRRLFSQGSGLSQPVGSTSDQAAGCPQADRVILVVDLVTHSHV